MINRQDLQKLIIAFGSSLILSFLLVSLTAGHLKVRKVSVPEPQSINSDFPLVTADSHYKAIFNNQAVDPTPLVQVGSGQNNQPFGQ